jgi:hypothetical protein
MCCTYIVTLSISGSFVCSLPCFTECILSAQLPYPFPVIWSIPGLILKYAAVLVVTYQFPVTWNVPGLVLLYSFPLSFDFPWPVIPGLAPGPAILVSCRKAWTSNYVLHTCIYATRLEVGR